MVADDETFTAITLVMRRTLKSRREWERRENPQTVKNETQREVAGGLMNKKRAYSVEKDLWPNADMNSLVLFLSKNSPIAVLSNSAILQSTSCLHVNVHNWLPTHCNWWSRQHTSRFRIKITLKVLIYTSAWFPGITFWIYVYIYTVRGIHVRGIHIPLT